MKQLPFSKHLTLLLYFILCCSTTALFAENSNLNRLASKLIPSQAKNIRFVAVKSEKDFFELETIKGVLVIRGNNGVSMARGLNHYLRNYLHRTTSWTGDNLKWDVKLPAIDHKVRIEATVPLRYYLNYCTYSYTMAYWSWDQWEDEIDKMALQGINMPLAAVTGQYAVWQNTLRRLGYTEKEITDFLPGPGYEAWWLMGNLEQFGGPISQAFIDQNSELQKKIVARMKEYGMKPILQGFYGMVPNSLIKKHPESDIRDTGEWISYKRPAFLSPVDPLFPKVASIFYEEQEKLFGKSVFYGGDPFHEGGNSKGIDITAAATNIYKTMKESNPAAVWVLQGWMSNPTDALLNGLKSGETVIIDLMSCSRPQWGGVPNSRYYRENGFLDHNWIWSALPNFGGRIGMYGVLNSYASGPVFAAHHPKGRHLVGIGTAPEGIGTNPIDYDLIYDMAWTKDSIDVKSWVLSYAHYRYGISNKNADSALLLLGSTVYNSTWDADGPQESFFCARPSLKIESVSSWGTAKLYYQPQAVLNALSLLLKADKDLRMVDTYRYDVVDITRQLLADYSKHVLGQIEIAYKNKDLNSFKKYSSRFLEMIHDQDRLLSTRKEFLLGRWIEHARQRGTNPSEKNLFEQNAKRQISSWSSINSSLHDYAHKEWNGMLSGLYAPRWKSYFDFLQAELKGEKGTKPDFFKMETAWVDNKNNYLTKPTPKELEYATEVYEKYRTEIAEAYASYIGIK